jgi:flagellar basal-body rod protein FlgB
MAITDLPVFRAMKQKMMFHEARQQVLAENVSNADTPGYRAREMVEPEFFRMVAEGDTRSSAAVVPAVTAVNHIASGALIAGSAFRSERVDGYEVSPDGNGVVLEEQMMKVTGNQMDYQVAASLYQRGLGILKTAIGRG